MSGRYILKDKKPIVCPDLIEWGTWFETPDSRRVAQTSIDGVNVLTVFLGFDHQFGEGAPLLFETMIFGGKHNEYQDRCSTWEEAEAMHQKAIDLVKSDQL